MDEKIINFSHRVHNSLLTFSTFISEKVHYELGRLNCHHRVIDVLTFFEFPNIFFRFELNTIERILDVFDLSNVCLAISVFKSLRYSEIFLHTIILDSFIFISIVIIEMEYISGFNSFF